MNDAPPPACIRMWAIDLEADKSIAFFKPSHHVPDRQENPLSPAFHRDY